MDLMLLAAFGVIVGAIALMVMPDVRTHRWLFFSTLGLGAIGAIVGGLVGRGLGDVARFAMTLLCAVLFVALGQALSHRRTPA